MRVPGLDQAVGELEAIDVTRLSDGELHHLVLLHMRVVSRLAAVRAGHVAEWDRRRVWDTDGSKQGWGRLMRECSLSEGTALVGMARNSRAGRQGQYRKPDPLITVHVGLGAFTRMCQLADGTVVSPTQVFPLLAEADVERIVFDGPSRVIDVGVRQRFFTGALRRALQARDLHCQHESGCDVPAHRCQGEHKIPYSEGGLTTQDNGEMLCPVHNRQRQRRRKNQRPPPDDTS